MKYKSLLLVLIGFLFSACNTAPSDKPSAESIAESNQKLWSEKDRQFILDELDRTSDELMNATKNLGIDQWTYREDPNRWTIAEIVEHLTIQNELHYREIYATSNAPSMPRFLSITNGQDAHFQKYATDPAKSQAKWFLQPLDRFISKRKSIEAFQRARDGLRDFVEATEIDLRQHFTFRNKAGDKNIAEIKIGEVRDLHQLLLTGIAHTDRHLRQIRELKKHKGYPRNI